MSKFLKILVKKIREIFPETGTYFFDKFTEKNRDLANGQIQFDIQDGKGFYRAVGADSWIPFKGSWTLTFTLSGNATGNVNGEVLGPSCVTTTTIKCVNGVITETSGTSANGSQSGTPHSNICRISVSNFKLITN